MLTRRVVSFQYPRVLHYSLRFATFSRQHCRDAKVHRLKLTVAVTRVTFRYALIDHVTMLFVSSCHGNDVLFQNDVQFPL